MRLHLIFARSRNGVVGKDNALPWHLPEDLAHFKRHTLGCPVIMGRKTWDSLPPKFRPLPGRTNVVVTRQADWTPGPRPEATSPLPASPAPRTPPPVAGPGKLTTAVLVAHSLEQALQYCAHAPDVWVIGGAQLWALALPLAHSAVVTEIDTEVEGDAFAPTFGPQWQEIRREEHIAASGLRYSFVTLQHTTPPPQAPPASIRSP